MQDRRDLKGNLRAGRSWSCKERLDWKVGESRYELAIYLEEPDNIKSVENNSSKDLESLAGVIVNHGKVIYRNFKE